MTTVNISGVALFAHLRAAVKVVGKRHSQDRIDKFLSLERYPVKLIAREAKAQLAFTSRMILLGVPIDKRCNSFF